MKTNKAPDKIYLIRNFSNPTALNTTDDHHGGFLYEWYKSREKDADVEYIRNDVFVAKAKEAFCKATCNGYPPRSTCTSLGTCKEYDNFVKLLKEE